MISVCSPKGYRGRTIRFCSTCECRRRFVVTYYEWYDADWRCCGCGDSWSGGERMVRPFERGWRERARKANAKAWAGATMTQGTGEQGHAR